MENFTWREWLTIAAFVVSLVALFVNISKFFIELYDRKEKRNKEAKEAKEKKKGKLTVNVVGKDIVIQNVSTVDVHIKEIYVDGKTWEESGLFLVDRPSKLSAGQTKKFTVYYDMQTPFPSGMSIQYADPFSREYMTDTWEKEFEL